MRSSLRDTYGHHALLAIHYTLLRQADICHLVELPHPSLVADEASESRHRSIWNILAHALLHLDSHGYIDLIKVSPAEGGWRVG